MIIAEVDGSMKSRGKGIDKSILAGSAVVGVIDMIVASLLYGLLRGRLWSPLAVGLSFMIFLIIFLAGMSIIKIIRDDKDFDSQAVLAVVAVLIFGILFEFIYEIDFFKSAKGYQDPTSYVFIIDNSGSMSNSDPQGLRYKAIDQIIQAKDASFPYAVYSFNDTITEERALAPVSKGKTEFVPTNKGGTEIKATLEQFLEMYQNGMKEKLGGTPKFLLLSDGHATDLWFFSSINGLLKEYAKTDIIISTVGLGDADDVLMQKIADYTGGVYLSVENVDQLEQSMQQAIKKNGNKYARTLYTHRNVPKFDALYAVLRILFASVLGIIVSGSMVFLFTDGDNVSLIVESTIIKAIAAGLLLEFGINALSLPTVLVRFVYFLLLSLTFVREKTFGGKGGGDDYQNVDEQQEIYRAKMGTNHQIGTSEKGGKFF